MIKVLIFVFFVLLILVALLVYQRIHPRSNYFGGEAGHSGNKEFEAKFLNIDRQKLRSKLEGIGAVKIHDDRLFRRTAYNIPEVKGFARVRDEGDNVTMTVKVYPPDSKYPQEYEVSINEDFETGRRFMEALNLKQKAYQETYREKWAVDDCNEVVMDNIPGLPTYAEIDCKSEERVFDVAEKLGYKKEDAHYGSFALTFEEVYGIPQKIVNEETPELTFENAEEALGPHVVKDKEKFRETIAAQRKIYSK